MDNIIKIKARIALLEIALHNLKEGNLSKLREDLEDWLEAEEELERQEDNKW